MIKYNTKSLEEEKPDLKLLERFQKIFEDKVDWSLRKISYDIDSGKWRKLKCS